MCVDYKIIYISLVVLTCDNSKMANSFYSKQCVMYDPLFVNLNHGKIHCLTFYSWSQHTQNIFFSLHATPLHVLYTVTCRYFVMLRVSSLVWMPSPPSSFNPHLFIRRPCLMWVLSRCPSVATPLALFSACHCLYRMYIFIFFVKIAHLRFFTMVISHLSICCET